MHFEFRHSSCTGRVHQHRTVLGHHGFKFCPFSQTIPRMASAPSIPKDIFLIHDYFGLLTKKNSNFVESQAHSCHPLPLQHHESLNKTATMEAKQHPDPLDVSESVAKTFPRLPALQNAALFVVGSLLPLAYILQGFLEPQNPLA